MAKFGRILGHVARGVAAIAVIGALSSAVSAKETEEEQAAPAADIPPFPAWDAFVDDLRDLWPQVAAKVPPEMREDPQVRQELGRLMLEALAARTIDAVGSDGDHPWFLPHIGLLMNVFQPNADTIYRNTRITPGGSYRLRGKRGTLPIFKMAQFGPTPVDTGGGVHAHGYEDFSTLNVDAEGRFDVILSPVRPDGYDGDWWELNPETTQLMIRQMSSDWAGEDDPTVAIERLDTPVQSPRIGADELERRLRWIGPTVKNSATFLVDHVVQLREEGYVNKLKIFDVVTNLGGLFGQFYYEGAYELAPDEALIMEAEVPSVCAYASLILTNDIYETTDWYNNQASLNNAQWQVDADGILRVVVSAKDPGVPNWLDTSGYPTGAVQGRWTDCNAQPVPSVRLVKLDALRDELPAETPSVTQEERQQIIRDRRAAYQQRPHW